MCQSENWASVWHFLQKLYRSRHQVASLAKSFHVVSRYHFFMKLSQVTRPKQLFLRILDNAVTNQVLGQKRRGVIFCNRREFVIMTKTTFVINLFHDGNPCISSKCQNVKMSNSTTLSKLLGFVTFCICLAVWMNTLLKTNM